MLLALYDKNYQTTFQSQNSIKLEATRLFLVKNNDMSKLVFNSSSLYFKNDLLLDEVSSFSINTVVNLTNIDICIEQDKICQTWKIKTI